VEINYLLEGLLLGWLSLAVLIMLVRKLRNWWYKRTFGVSIDHSVLSMVYGRKLTNAVDQDQLAQLLTQELPDKLGVEKSILLLREVHQLISIADKEVCLPLNHTAVRRVAASGEAQVSDRGELRDLIAQGRTDLSWTRVWVPLMRGVELGGMWFLGKRQAGRRYSSDDLRWLTMMAREAAAVLDAMRFTEREHQAASEMRALYREMIAAREAERGRLSRELHDGVLQDMCAMARDLKALKIIEGEVDSSIADLVNLSGETVQSLRDICNDLRPPLLSQDLISALKTLVDEMDARSTAPVHIDIRCQQDELRLSDDVALAIFRILQEGLNNALQHADASEIAVRLTEYPDRLRLTITDDGQGISGDLDSAGFVAGGHYGIAGMRERAAMIGGQLNVQTSYGYGTVVILELPI